MTTNQNDQKVQVDAPDPNKSIVPSVKPSTVKGNEIEQEEIQKEQEDNGHKHDYKTPIVEQISDNEGEVKNQDENISFDTNNGESSNVLSEKKS